MRLAAAEKRVDNCSSDGCIMISAEQVVLATYSDGTDCIFNTMVVNMVSLCLFSDIKIRKIGVLRKQNADFLLYKQYLLHTF